MFTQQNVLDSRVDVRDKGGGTGVPNQTSGGRIYRRPGIFFDQMMCCRLSIGMPSHISTTLYNIPGDLL